ncbi:MAG: hypothetical protein ACFFCD_00935 [Promethearchaeota archaeon]
MKLKFLTRRKKGQIHTLEAIVAVVIMIIFAFSVFQFYSVQAYESQSVEELKERGRSALTALDESGKLKDWVAFDEGDDDANLKAALQEMLPSDVGFNLTVFSDSLGGTVEDTVTSGVSPPPPDKPIATVNYMLRIADTSDIDDVRYIRFQLWYI